MLYVLKNGFIGIIFLIMPIVYYMGFIPFLLIWINLGIQLFIFFFWLDNLSFYGDLNLLFSITFSSFFWLSHLIVKEIKAETTLGPNINVLWFLSVYFLNWVCCYNHKYAPKHAWKNDNMETLFNLLFNYFTYHFFQMNCF